MYHNPVLLNESVEGLAINKDGVYVDVTFGGGGHSKAILEKLDKGRLIAFDQDKDAWLNAPADKRFELIKKNFSELKSSLNEIGVEGIDGLLADLGVSSHQFDEPQRGFSTRFDGPLDMRMDDRLEKTAADIVNEYDEMALRKMFGFYGEVKNAGKLASVIVFARKERQIRTIAEFKEMIRRCVIKGKENQYYAQVFQALRIEVNNELEVLKSLLTQALQVLKPGGRLVVISYHSLEDKLVKNFMREGLFEGEAQRDIYGNRKVLLKMVNTKPIVPSEQEIETNSRARSARLRIAEKINE